MERINIIKIMLWNSYVEMCWDFLSSKYSVEDSTLILKEAVRRLDFEHKNEITKLKKEYWELLLAKWEDLRKYEEKIRQKDNEIEILKEKNRKKCILF